MAFNIKKKVETFGPASQAHPIQNFAPVNEDPSRSTASYPISPKLKKSDCCRLSHQGLSIWGCYCTIYLNNKVFFIDPDFKIKRAECTSALSKVWNELHDRFL
jgi:hypothetical protein